MNIKKFSLIAVSFVLVGVLTGCDFLALDESSTAEASQKNSSGNSSQSQTSEKSQKNDSSDWTIDSVVEMLKEKDVITNEKLLEASGEAELQGTGITEMVSYASEDDSIFMMILYFDPNSTDAATKVHIETLSKDKSISIDGEVMVADKVLGTVFIRYSDSVDESFYEKVNSAFEEA